MVSLVGPSTHRGGDVTADLCLLAQQLPNGWSMTALVAVAGVDRWVTGTFELSLCAGVSSGGEQKRK